MIILLVSGNGGSSPAKFMTLATSIRQYAPRPIITWLKRKRVQWHAQKREAVRRNLIAKHGTFTAMQLVNACREAGIRKDGILFVQCSFNDLYTFSGSPYDLLEALIELSGSAGTLLMPAYSSNMAEDPCRLFDARREPVNTGILPELFRRQDGVIRSLHPRHSLCAIGPRAAELLAGHEDCVYADGPGSPFDRIRQMDAQSLCLGMAPGFNSFVHWVEDIDPAKYPIRAHDGPYECLLRDSHGVEIRRSFYRRTSGQRKQEKLVGENLSEEALKKVSFFGVDLCIYSWPAFADELIALRDRGIVYYT